MITGLTGQDLPQWMATAREAGLPGIASFAKGLEQDLDAVTNGLTMNWSSGPVEGRVNRIILWNQICQVRGQWAWSARLLDSGSDRYSVAGHGGLSGPCFQVRWTWAKRTGSSSMLNSTSSH
jgi:hypothetical protein